MERERRPVISAALRRALPRRRALAALVTGLLLCTGGAVIAVSRGVSPVVLDLTDGGAWLVSSQTGTVTHLSGPAGRADAAVAVPDGAGHDLAVVEAGSYLLVTDRDAGRVHRVEPARLAADRSADLPPGAQVTYAAGQAYAVDAESGRVQRLDPVGLSALGRAIDLAPGLGRSAQSPDGTLWVPAPADGTVTAVRAGDAGPPIPVAPAGNRIDALVMDDRPVVVDSTAGTVILLGREGPERTIPLPGEPGNGFRSSARIGGKLLPLVAPETRQLLLADVETGQVSVVELPRSGDGAASDGTPAAPAGPAGGPNGPAGGPNGPSDGPNGPSDGPDGRGDEPGGPADRADGQEDPAAAGPDGQGGAAGAAGRGGLGEPVPHAGHVYIPDSPAGRVLDLDLGTGQFAAPIPVAPAGSQARITVTVKDDQVWINDEAGVNAVVIGDRGQVAIPKQAVGLPGLPGQSARPLPPPPPRPSPDSAGQGSQAASSPDRGTGQPSGRTSTGTPSADQVEPTQVPSISPTPRPSEPPPVVPPPTSPVPTTRPTPTTARPEPTTTPSQDDQVDDAGSRGRR